MIAIGGILQILPSSYIPASRPVTHGAVMPVGSINLFVGFTGAIDPAATMIVGGSPPHRDLLLEE